MARLFKIVEDHKASKWLRFANYCIDLAVIYVLAILFYAILGIYLALFTDVNVDEFANNMEENNSFLDKIASLLIYGFLMFLIEFFSKGRSLGKLITGTMVVKTDASPLTLKDYFIRNISRAIPFDQLSFLGNNGWHDTIFDTRVVNKKNFEKDRSLKLDLDNLGNNS